jgi:hypothetical protein
MYLDVSQVMADDLRHRSWTCGHNPLPVPQRVVESLPCRFEEVKRLRQVDSEFISGPARASGGRSICVVPIRVELSNLTCGWTSEDPDVRPSLVRQVGDHMAAGVSGQQARPPEVVIRQRLQGREERSMSLYAEMDVGIGLHLEKLIRGSPPRL